MKKGPAVLDNWEEGQYDPLTLPPDDFSGLSLREAVEQIREWFFENFENPARIARYEGDGRHWGESYSTSDIIENVFADIATDKVIKTATDELNAEGHEWVPNPNGRQAPEKLEEYPLDTTTLHIMMRRRVSLLEEILAHLPAEPAGVGHNNPPEPIEAPFIGPGERAAILGAVEVLKAQPVEPADDGEAASQAVRVVERTANRFRDWLAKQGDTFVSEAVKEGGKEFGKWAPRALIALFVERAFSLSSIVAKWLESIGLPF
jgi:hypothetical protein